MKNSLVLSIAAGVGAVAIAAALLFTTHFTTSPTDEGRLSLSPVPLLIQMPGEIAKRIVEAAEDEIVTLRLNDTDALNVVAFTTVKGDIIIPNDRMEEEARGSVIYYRIDAPMAQPLGSDYGLEGSKSKLEKSSAMNYSRMILDRIGYKLDGTEHVYVEGLADYDDATTTITIYQTVSGCQGSLEVMANYLTDTCIIINHPAAFHFQKDSTWMELRRWYEDVHHKAINVNEMEAITAAKIYLENERMQDPQKFETYGNLTFNDFRHFVLKESFADNLVYAVTVSYLTDKDYHCAPSMNFDVFVRVVDGKVIGWRQSPCV